MRRVYVANNGRDAILHQVVGFSDPRRLFDDIHLTDPRLLRPVKLGDQVVVSSNLLGALWFRRPWGDLPSPSCARRTANQVDPSADGILVGVDPDWIPLGEGGFEVY